MMIHRSEVSAGPSLFDAALEVLRHEALEVKLACSARHAAAWRAGGLSTRGGVPVGPLAEPGRPARPCLVPPRELPRRSLNSREGLAALLHAVAHIEFNAIHLAWDAVYRFRDLPHGWYDDWVRIAEEEAYHFGLVRERLRELGYDYGDFPAHDGLWQAACETAHDPLVRMAVVPRALEARGLDVNPAMRARLLAAGEQRGAEILDIILRDEIGHVAVGSHWFHHLCRERGLAPQATYRELVGRHLRGGLKGPFNHAARLQAGFSAEEMAALEGR